MQAVKRELEKLKNPEKAKVLSRFFKTGKGEYGEGDIFLGVNVPEQRKIAKKYRDAGFRELKNLLSSGIHEHRLTALLILVEKYKAADENMKNQVADFYITNLTSVDNWDLVDLSADKILGDYFFDKDKSIFYKLAKSGNLWERRASIVATFNFIRKGKFDETLRIAELLLSDKHDLIHKAVGWMLREIGKRDQEVEENFLRKHHKKMPRTMLRYATERFSENKRRFYLST